MLYARRRSTPHGSGWRSMDTAPRDGTTVELCCTYGIMPWYDLFKWTDERTIPVHGAEGVVEIRKIKGEFGWVKVGDENGGVSDEAHLQWRPTDQSPNSYVDPTGGAQFNGAYWGGIPGDMRSPEFGKAARPARTALTAEATERHEEPPWIALFCALLLAMIVVVKVLF